MRVFRVANRFYHDNVTVPLIPLVAVKTNVWIKCLKSLLT